MRSNSHPMLRPFDAILWASFFGLGLLSGMTLIERVEFPRFLSAFDIVYEPAPAVPIATLGAQLTLAILVIVGGRFLSTAKREQPTQRAQRALYTEPPRQVAAQAPTLAALGKP